jgi:sulfoxide reductase catalytic subunit YedY
MIIRTRKPSDVPSSEITPEDVYMNRRRFIRDASAGAAALAFAPSVLGASVLGTPERGSRQQIPARFQNMKTELDEDLNPYSDVTGYNNFYEFGTGKEDPARNAGDFKPKPWTVRVGGLVDKPGEYQLEDFIGPSNVEDRVYRMRCVEAWSVVVPWRGFPLSDVINRVEPTGDAKFVEFKTIVRPEEMPGQNTGVLDWPYTEGLRMDEAMNPLTLMTTGLYGMDLPNQNGAPLRLITPWKYGFKGVKSIVSMNFVEDMPLNTWWVQNRREYGFYANVNPEVDHPRWTQARERRLGELRRRETLMFNGYTEQVQSMYEGMDLTRWI